MNKVLVALCLISLAFAGCTESPDATSENPGPTTTAAPEVGGNSTESPDERRPLLEVAEQTTKNASVSVLVASDSGAFITVRNDADGWTESFTFERVTTVDVPLAPGNNAIIVTADEATETRTAEESVARLVQGTVVLQFNQYPGHSDREDLVWFNPDGAYSAPMYADVPPEHLGIMTAHDLLVFWSDATGVDVEFVFSNELNAYSVSSIDGAKNPIESSAPPWWCYTVNEEAAEGISIQPIGAGDTMLWDFGECGFVPA